MTTFGYARVSDDGQTLDSQLDALKAEGADRIFKEKMSGARADRPELAKLLGTIDKGDRLIVTQLDRLARSTRDLLYVIAALAERGASFKSLADRWADTTTPDGHLMLTMLNGLAAFDRELIAARTGEGRERAKALGRPLGRPYKLTQQQRERDLADLASGKVTQADLARRRKLSESAISRMVAKAKPGLSIRSRLDPATVRAARTFLRHIESRYAPLDMLVYGSRARGTHKPNSDADIAVILKGKRGDRSQIGIEMAGIAVDVLDETGILVSALPLWESELNRPASFSNPALIEAIRRDGLRP